jgi:hypothetical protein
MTDFLPGNITVDNGVDAPYVLTTSEYTYANDVITFNDPIADGQVDDDGDPLTPDVDQDGLVDITVELVAQPVAQFLSTQDIVDEINSSGAPVTASIDGSDFVVVTSSIAQLTMTGNALLDIGFATTSVIESKLANLADDLNSLTYLDSYISGDILIIETDEDELTLSGSAFNDLGFPSNTFETNSNPTASSVAQQINSLNIPNISASVSVGRLKISSNSPSIVIEENSSTPGSMLRIGFAQTLVEIDSIDSIISDLNTALSDLYKAQKRKCLIDVS